MSLRALAMLGTLSLFAGLATPQASAISFTDDPTTQTTKTMGNTGSSNPINCPTLTERPRYYEAWFNTDDMEYRGYTDPKNQTPWSFIDKAAQLICGAEYGAKIYLGMYFIRAGALHTSRPETDSEEVWKAMEWVHKYRGVKIEFVLDGGSISSSSAKDEIKKRLRGIASINWCKNGCMNTNSSSATFPFAINHEKFVAVSDTIWDNPKDANGYPRTRAQLGQAACSTSTAASNNCKPFVYSSSGQFARSQVRTYWQEATLLYDDQKLYNLVYDRFRQMKMCTGSNSGGSDCKGGKWPGMSALKKSQFKKQRGIWVDLKYRNYTDANRGTTISFSPQPSSVTDYYTAQLEHVDCKVDKKIRIAMYRLTDTRAVNFVKLLQKLKKEKCDIKMLLSQEGGATTISKKVAKMLKNAGLKEQVRCTAYPIHTKLVLIGPEEGNSGRVMFGTANMSTAGLRYSEEHVITIDSRRASPTFRADIEDVFGVYLEGWNELSQGNKVCH